MRVLHVSGASVWGGNEQQLFDLMDGLQKLQIENILFCFKDSPVELKAKQNNINYYSIHKAKSHSLKYAKNLRACIKTYKPDVIHLHTSNTLTAFVIADVLFKLKTPTVFSKKAISAASSGLSTFKYNYKNINRIICVSKAVEDAFKNVLKSKNHHKLCVVFDGINIMDKENKTPILLKERYSIPTSRVLIGNIANHTNAKDLVTLVKTANELINNLEVKNVHFLQIGKEGKQTSSFMPLIKEYNLESYFTVAGFLEDAKDLLPQFDVFLMTSEREGGPTSILDAMYRKIPVVTTKVGITAEAITHQKNGMLCDVKDYKSLAFNLKELILDKDKQTQFAELSYEILINKFTAKQLAANTLLVYNNVIK